MNKSRRTLTNLGLILLMTFGIVSRMLAQNIIYPFDAGVINVKNSPYNAKGDGVTDDTQAIQAALTAADNHAIVYFPNGTYIVSNSLLWKNASSDNGGWRAYLSIQGQSRAGAIIKLKNNTFTDVANPKAIIVTGSRDDQNRYSDLNGEGNQAFENSISFLTIDVGSGNAGAIAVDYQVSNWGAMRQVTIKSSDPGKAGFCGISLLRRDNGPGLIEKVSIDGFQYGIRAGQEIAQFTLENVTVTNQSVVGIEDKEAIMAIRNLASVNSVPAIRASSQSLLNLLNGNLTGGASTNSAIEFVNNESRGYLRGITTSGYNSAIKSRGTVINGSSVSEWVSDPVLKLNPSGKISLNLQIEETPTYFDSNLSNWISVGTPNGTDDTQAIQTAMNSGKSTVYFPPYFFYRISNTITVPASVKHIVGMNGIVKALSTLGNKSMFKFEGGVSSDQTIMERFEISHDYFGAVIEDASARTLVLTDVSLYSNGVHYKNQPGAGKLFLNNVAGGYWRFNYPQNVWARSFNTEGQQKYVVNNGGNLWVLGHKVENTETLFETRNGGSTEVLGSLTYTFGDRGKPAIINNGSRTSISIGGTSYVQNGVWNSMVWETSASETKELTVGGTYGGRTYSIPMYVGEASASSAPYRINAGGFQAAPYLQNEYSSGANTGTFFTTDPIDVSAVTNPAPQSVYQSELNDLSGPGGTFAYTFPYLVSGKSYKIRLHFVERYFTNTGGRKFHVDINGSRLITDFDIFAAAGAKNKAVVKEIAGIADANGTIEIKFTTVTDRALVNGIEILTNESSTATKLEAELATINNALIFDHPQASNGKTVGRIDFADSYVQYNNVLIPTAGTYRLSIAYTNAMSSNSTHNVSINGATTLSPTYPPTGSWGNVAVTSIPVQLQAGNNTIRFSKATNYAELDYIKIDPVTVTRLEAELAAFNNARITDRPSASNGRTIGGIDFTDSYVQFNNISVNSAGTYQITVRYSNSMGANSTHLVSANGGSNATITYPATANWDTFSSSTINVNLNAGINSIRFTKGTLYAELDFIELASASGGGSSGRLRTNDVAQELNVESVDSEVVKLFPNPASHELIIDSQETLIEIDIFDAMGKPKYQTRQMTNKLLINVENLPSGLYLVKARTINNRFIEHRIIIE